MPTVALENEQETTRLRADPQRELEATRQQLSRALAEAAAATAVAMELLERAEGAERQLGLRDDQLAALREKVEALESSQAVDEAVDNPDYLSRLVEAGG
jgi:Fe2+ transport system protein B